jgi:hypothetical protein
MSPHSSVSGHLAFLTLLRWDLATAWLTWRAERVLLRERQPRELARRALWSASTRTMA